MSQGPQYTKILPALIGGIIAGIFWQISSQLFAKGVASSTKYFAIYSSLAIVILFMIWQYISWLIVLLGAQISYCAQKIDYSGINLKSSEVSSKLKERIVLSVMYLIGNNFSKGLENLSLDRIVELTNMPYEFVYSSIKDLCEKNLLVESADTPTTFLPAKELELNAGYTIAELCALDPKLSAYVCRAAKDAAKTYFASAGGYAEPDRIKTLSGSVLTELGRPAADVRLVATLQADWKSDDAALRFWTATDANGRYTLRDLPQGDNLVGNLSVLFRGNFAN